MMSKIQLSPFFNFQGRAREAMEFYHKVLGGKLDLYTLNEQGVSKPAGPGDSIRHSRLEADGALIFATDGHPDYPAKVGENMAIALGGTDKARLTRLFNDLAEGGKILGPLMKQPWGADVGWLTDKFGVNWTVSVDKA
jgi:PhnB protein